MSSDYYGASRPDVKERDLAQNDAVVQTDGPEPDQPWSQEADDAITAARFAGDAMAAERARRS